MTNLIYIHKLLMKAFLSNLLIALVGMVALSSCDAMSPDKRLEATKIVESRTCKELLNDLYLGSDGDEEAIARILDITPSVVKRIRNGETVPSLQLEERVKDVSVYYQLNGKNFLRLRSELDPKWRFIDTMGHLPSVNPKLFWTILLVLIAALAFVLVIYFWFMWPYLLGATITYLVVILLFWILSSVFPPKAMPDPYVDSINPVVEQIV